MPESTSCGKKAAVIPAMGSGTKSGRILVQPPATINFNAVKLGKNTEPHRRLMRQSTANKIRNPLQALLLPIFQHTMTIQTEVKTLLSRSLQLGPRA
ncbi:MAG: hypothetical protein PHF75_03535, partial [Gallionella sp.]|nr:hypothetical protein [Gallionella sp.]